MVRMASAQKIFTVVEERGIWGHPCRLVLSQKSDNRLILKKAPKTQLGLGWVGLRAVDQRSPSGNFSLTILTYFLFRIGVKVYSVYAILDIDVIFGNGALHACIELVLCGSNMIQC